MNKKYKNYLRICVVTFIIIHFNRGYLLLYFIKNKHFKVKHIKQIQNF